MLNISYCSDKYQYTMGKSFYDLGMKDKRAIFNLFFRKAPDNNNWAVVSGVKEGLEMISGLGSADEHFFEQFLPEEEYREYRKYLANMKFTGNVYAMKEGEIAFPQQPIITVEAPLIEAQVLETPLLCIMNHQMAIATKASRVTRSTNKPVSEFGSRRAHGPWAAMYGAKAAYIGGCRNSSNILAAVDFGFPSSGTMAHSFVTSFGSTIKGEYEAFSAYIKTHKNEFIILLIDTYDTLNCGIRNAIKAFKDNGIDDTYPYGYGIRLDSGDLAYLSRKCRKELDNSCLTKCKIIATNSLDEYLIPELEKQDAAIDSYGVGDAIATSKHNPCFGNVYKLVQIDNEPVLKVSEDKSKLINPGFQITYRIIIEGLFKADVTCLRGDHLAKAIENGESFTIRDEFDETKKKSFEKGTYTYKTLQEQVMKGGTIISPNKSIDEKRNYYLDNLAHLNPTEKRLINPHYYKVDISDEIFNIKKNLIKSLIAEIKENDDRGINYNRTHIVVDMLYDFIDGALACGNAENAVNASIKHINENPEERVLYICDAHPINHCSFAKNGGQWPVHCVEGTHGGAIHNKYYNMIGESKNLPSSNSNIFYKGRNKNLEQYSGFEATNNIGKKLEDIPYNEVIVSGIATEYCVKETVLDFLKKGFKVSILADALGYIDIKSHEKTLEELKLLGANII